MLDENELCRNNNVWGNLYWRTTCQLSPMTDQQIFLSRRIERQKQPASSEMSETFKKRTSTKSSFMLKE